MECINWQNKDKPQSDNFSNSGPGLGPVEKLCYTWNLIASQVGCVDKEFDFEVNRFQGKPLGSVATPYPRPWVAWNEWRGVRERLYADFYNIQAKLIKLFPKKSAADGPFCNYTDVEIANAERGLPMPNPLETPTGPGPTKSATTQLAPPPKPFTVERTKTIKSKRSRPKPAQRKPKIRPKRISSVSSAQF